MITVQLCFEGMDAVRSASSRSGYAIKKASGLMPTDAKLNSILCARCTSPYPGLSTHRQRGLETTARSSRS